MKAGNLQFQVSSILGHQRYLNSLDYNRLLLVQSMPLLSEDTARNCLSPGIVAAPVASRKRVLER
jgi:hypothetical protein